ncbi:MAG: ribosome maturation factor RimM [Caldimicrobium sp.]|nr:ribosome maturation factor RimM [Caldimicrobium sp.]MCX7613187.1 ribosome maturation factor RimM [Caldimicrobium sp.]MDW8182511.1 ribosome maturation factor RimM [Caldimicrobium sp.]
MVKKNLIPLYKVLSTHGLKGNLKVALLSSEEDLPQKIQTLYLPKPQEKILKVKEVKKAPVQYQFIISFEDLNYDEAKTLINQILYAKPEDLPEPSTEEIYYFQLEDLEVVDLVGKLWGKVVKIMPMGEYALLLIKSEERPNFYLPLVEEYVEEINLSEGVLKVKDISALVEAQS